MNLSLFKLQETIYSGTYSTDPKTKDAVQFPPNNSKNNLMVVINSPEDLKKIRSQRKFDFSKNIQIYGPSGERVQIYNDTSKTSGTKQILSKYNKFFQLDEKSDFFKDLDEKSVFKDLDEIPEIIFLLNVPAYYRENLNSQELNVLLKGDLDIFNSYKFINKITFFTSQSFWSKFSDTLNLTEYSVIKNKIYDETIKSLYEYSHFNPLGKLINYIFGKELGGEIIPQYVLLKFKREDNVQIIHPRDGRAKIYNKSDSDYDEIRIECITDGEEHQFLLISSGEPIDFKYETNLLEDFESQILMHKKHKDLRKKFDEAEDKKKFLEQQVIGDYHIEYNRFEKSDDPTKDIIIGYFESFFNKLSNDYQRALTADILSPPKRIGYDNFLYHGQSIPLSRQTSYGNMKTDSFH